MGHAAGFDSGDSAAPVSLSSNPTEDAQRWQYEFENAGFPLATSLVRDDGQIAISLGRIEALEIKGGSDKIRDKIQAILIHTLGPVVTIMALEDALNLINDLPGVSAVFALERLDDSDGYRLVVDVDSWEQSGQLSLDNIPQDAPGSRVSIHQQWHSLFTGGDELRLTGTYSHNQHATLSLDAAYQFFVGHEGRYMEIGLRRASPANDFWSLKSDAEQSKTDGMHVVYGVPLTRASNENRVVYGKLTHDQSDDSSVKASHVTGQLAYFHRYDADDGFSYSGGFSLGAGRGGPSTSNARTFNLFKFGAGVIVPVRVISSSAELRLESYGQAVGQDAPTSELMYLGGADHLRGFLAGHYHGHRGLNFTLELADVFPVEGAKVNAFKPFVFYDWGKIGNAALVADSFARPRSAHLASAGVGLDVVMKDGWSARSWLGKPVKDSLKPVSGHAVYLQINKGW